MFNIIGGLDMMFMEVNIVFEVVILFVDLLVNVIFGFVVDEKYTGEIAVIIVATGF